MKKTVLVIGGSLFCGRIFCIQASRADDISLHVVNRGTHPPLNLPNVQEFTCERHDTKALLRLLPQDAVYNAVIDFCAYAPGDVRSLLAALGGRFRQYLVLSTASVYVPSDRIKTEDEPLIKGSNGSPVSDYIYNKLIVERETLEICGSLGVPYTIFRPNFIYGPLNYAPREPWFVRLIARGEEVPVPTDATARFSMVYAPDLSKALALCIENETAFNQIFNFSAPEEISYELMLRLLEKFHGGPFKTRRVTVREVLVENIPLPFPLTDDDLCSGKKFSDAFGFVYTPFEEGMEKTFKAFYPIFKN